MPNVFRCFFMQGDNTSIGRWRLQVTEGFGFYVEHTLHTRQIPASLPFASRIYNKLTKGGDMYRTTKEKSLTTNATCPECGSKTVLYRGGTLTCTNCAHILSSPKVKKNKYNAVRTVAKDGLKRDSKFEASVADELYLRKQAGDIKDYESQFKVTIPIYSHDGEIVHTVSHKIDFRIHKDDGSFTLYEAKGKETPDYIWRRKLLEVVWLPEHPDHEYEVRYQHNRRRAR